uniref:NADH-ubiquinone oxidoreductase chain 2 n=1 Tax=Sacculina sp. 'Beibu Gulf' TaxID=2861897 RepID=A0A8F9W815_9CRUS|nr:NADH dehydrogenase subunit 2 [Sacculina sp. 'Beibu Gulf']
MLTYVFYFSSMLVSMYMTISSIDWFWSWMCMELNLFSFASIMIYSDSMKKLEESNCLYFLIQSVGSSILIFGLCLGEINQSFMFIVILGLFLKLAMYPVNLLLIGLSSSISWISLIFISSFMKVPSLYLVNNVSLNCSMVYMFTMMSSVIWGMQSNCLQKIYMSSSFIHMFWVISVMPGNWIMYWMIYFIFSAVFCLCLNMMSIYNLKDLLVIDYYKMFNVFLQLLSLAGFPPLIGFLLKLWCFILIDNMLLSFSLIFFSTLKNFFYIRLILNLSIFLKMFYKKTNYFNFANFLLMFSIILSIMSFKMI